MKKLLLALVALSCSNLAFGYTAADRFKLMEDKYKTFDFLNDDNEHLHILNLGLGANTEIISFFSDAMKIKDLAGAQKFTAKWKGTEQFLRLNVGLKIPLFSFEAWGVKVKPSIDINAGGGALIGVTEANFSLANILDFVGGFPPDLTACVSQVTEVHLETAGVERDIAKASELACGVPGGTFAAYYGQKAPDLGNAPVLAVMSKGDLKGGINFKFKKGGFFGRTGLNAVFRTDFEALISEETLFGDEGLVGLVKSVSLHGFLMGNLTAGYRYKMFSIQGGMDEIKLATAVDRTEDSGELAYGTPILFRLHGQANLSFASFSLRPYAGFSTRSGYTITQGMYAGADIGIHFMNKRFGMGIRGMVDLHHITIGVQPRLGIVQLDAMGKIPIAATVDGVAPPTIVSVGLSVFI